MGGHLNGDEALLRHRVAAAGERHRPVEPDGDGNSLVSALPDPTGNPNDVEYWASSYHIGGSPFADEPLINSDGPENQSIEDVRVYPNPTSDLLNIELPWTGNSQPATIKLYSINGMLLYQEDISGSSTIQLSGLNLSPGVYLLRVQMENQVQTKKIVFR